MPTTSRLRIETHGFEPLFKQTHCWAILGGDFEGYKHGHDPEVGISTISITKSQLINLNLDRLRKNKQKHTLKLLYFERMNIHNLDLLKAPGKIIPKNDSQT